MKFKKILTKRKILQLKKTCMKIKLIKDQILILKTMITKWNKKNLKVNQILIKHHMKYEKYQISFYLLILKFLRF